MQLKCTVCNTRFYSAADAVLDGPCPVAECPGNLAAARPNHLTLVK